MKNTVMFAAALAMSAGLAAPAMANEFTGLRAEVSAGVDDVTTVSNQTDVSYGAAIGFDAEVYDNIVVGLETNVDDLFNNEGLGVSARVGYVVADTVLIYGKAGYAQLEVSPVAARLEGLRVGGGAEVNVLGPLYAGAEYRYSDYELGVGQHAALFKVGFRF